MTFRYRWENGSTMVWSGSLGRAIMGSFLQEVPPSVIDGVLAIRSLKQVHGNVVLDDSSFKSEKQEADGLVSKRSRVILTIRTADCIPVFLVQDGRIGMVHAGWRSVKAGILEKSLEHFNPLKTSVVLGPSIWGQYYEVDKDLYGHWDDPDLSHFLQPGEGSKRFLDLRSLAFHILKRSGVPKKQLYGIPLCTYQDHLPSYRRNGKGAGRLIHAIRLIGKP